MIASALPLNPFLFAADGDDDLDIVAPTDDTAEDDDIEDLDDLAEEEEEDEDDDLEE